MDETEKAVNEMLGKLDIWIYPTTKGKFQIFTVIVLGNLASHMIISAIKNSQKEAEKKDKEKARNN